MEIEKIWSEYRTGLKSFLHSKISDADEVDDLLQEILIKLFNNIDTVKSEDHLKPWLRHQTIFITLYSALYKCAAM